MITSNPKKPARPSGTPAKKARAKVESVLAKPAEKPTRAKPPTRSAVKTRLGPQVQAGPMKAALGRAQVTTIRIREDVQEGLRLLEAHSGVRRPLNKWVNLALADFIDRQIAPIEEKLDQALKNIKAYRKTDPGYKKAIKAFIEAEVAHATEDPMEGTRERPAVGPGVSMVREMLRG